MDNFGVFQNLLTPASILASENFLTFYYDTTLFITQNTKFLSISFISLLWAKKGFFAKGHYCFETRENSVLIQLLLIIERSLWIKTELWIVAYHRA